MKKPMKQLIRVALFLLAGITAMTAGAKKLPVFVQPVSLDSMSVNSVITIHDDLMLTVPQTGDAWLQGYDIFSVTGRIVLKVKETTSSCLPDTFSCKVGVRIRYWKEDNSVDSLDTVLSVNYNKTSGIVYRAKDMFQVAGAHYMQVVILSISNAAAQDYLSMSAEIEEERYKTLSLTHLPAITAIDTSGLWHEGDIVISFSLDSTLLAGTEEYDLEWTFIEAYNSSGGCLSTSATWFDFRHNTSRVTIKTNTYRISNTFEKGYLICRVRAVGRAGINYDKRVEGPWSTALTNGLISSLPSGSYKQLNEHERTLNWQYQCSYAEEGKKKESMNYFDGSLRGRQSVTRTNSGPDSVALVQDKIYDHQGRLAIEVLPAPVQPYKIKYFPKLNLNAGDSAYNRYNFDLDVSYCESAVDSMMPDSGAARYYSSANAWTTSNNLSAMVPNFNNYVPVSNGFPFVLTEYTPDNTNRVARKTMPGATHQLNTGHETEYFYGTPVQEELDRLFGSQVGFAEHYQKNMVKDANGQLSISYLDAKGKVIATALAGQAPGSVETLDSNSARNDIEVNLMNGNDTLVIPDGIVTSKTFLVTDSVDYKFYYSLLTEKFDSLSCMPTDTCMGCVYDLEISLQSQCGELLKGDSANPTVYATLRRTIGPAGKTAQVCGSSTATYKFAGDDLAQVVSDSFLTVRLAPGSYTITKSLRVNKEQMELYLENYLNSYTCKTLSDFEAETWAKMDTTGCELTCTTCLSKLGSQNAYRDTFLAERIRLGYTPTANDSAEALRSYQLRLAECNKLCDSIPDMCDGMLEMFKADMRPGGQYATFEEEDGVFSSDASNSMLNPDATISYKKLHLVAPYDSVFVKNSAWINGGLVSYKDMSADQFINHWQDSFADHLVILHPEYCQYTWCLANRESEKFNMDMLTTETYESALAKGLLNPIDSATLDTGDVVDPFFKKPTGGYPLLSNMDTKLRYYQWTWDYNRDHVSYTNDSVAFAISAWDLIVASNFCSAGDRTVPVSECIAQYRDSAQGCNGIRDSYWENFRAIYLGFKTHIVDSIKKVTCNPSALGGGEIRIPNNPTGPYAGLTKEQLYDRATDSISDHCTTQCESYADYWMKKLAGCGIHGSDSTKVRDSLIRVCVLGCDESHPFGSSTVATQYLTDASVVNKSFKDVLQSYATYVPGVCDENLISMPKPYGHYYFGAESPYSDTCACDESSYNDQGLGGFCTDTVTVPNSDCPCAQSKNNDAKKAMLLGKGVADQYKCKQCIGCEQFGKAYNTFYQKYGIGVEDSSNFEELFTNHLNNELHFNLAFKDYMDFAASCAQTTNDTGTLNTFRQTYQIEPCNFYASIEGYRFYIPGSAEPTYLIAQSRGPVRGVSEPPIAKREEIRVSSNSLSLTSIYSRWLPKLSLAIGRIEPQFEIGYAGEVEQTDLDPQLTDKKQHQSNALQVVDEMKGWEVTDLGMRGKVSMPFGAAPPEVKGVQGNTGNRLPDECDCIALLRADSIARNNPASPYGNSGKAAFEYFYTGGNSFPDYNKLLKVCCKAAKGESINDISEINTTGTTDSTCEPPPANPGTRWNSAQLNALNNSNNVISAYNAGNDPDILMSGNDPVINIDCPDPPCDTCGTKTPDVCACNLIMEEYDDFQELGEEGETFAHFFASRHGTWIENLDSVQALCRTVFETLQGEEASGTSSAWEQYTIDVMKAMAQRLGMKIPDNLCDDPDEPADPDTTGLGTIIPEINVFNWVDCADEKAVIDSIMALHGIGSPSAIFDDPALLAEVVGAINSRFGADYTADDLEFEFRSSIYCCWRYGPDESEWGAECQDGPWTGTPTVIDSSACGDSCFLASSMLGLVKDYLNQLTEAHATVFGIPLAYLISNNWDMFAEACTTYTSTALHGSEMSNLRYHRLFSNNLYGNRKNLLMGMTDVPNKAILLEIPDDNPAHIFDSVIEFSAIRLRKTTICPPNGFAIKAVFRNGAANETVVLRGTVYNISITDLMDCGKKYPDVCGCKAILNADSIARVNPYYGSGKTAFEQLYNSGLAYADYNKMLYVCCKALHGETASDISGGTPPDTCDRNGLIIEQNWTDTMKWALSQSIENNVALFMPVGSHCGPPTPIAVPGHITCEMEKMVIDNYLAVHGLTLIQVMTSSTHRNNLATDLNTTFGPLYGSNYTGDGLAAYYFSTSGIPPCWKTGVDPNKPKLPNFPSVTKQCDSCYLAAGNLKLVQTYLNALCAANGDSNYLTSNAWSMASFTSYTTSLYGGGSSGSLQYTRSFFTGRSGPMSGLELTMNDGSAPAKYITLDLLADDSGNKYNRVRAFYGIRLMNSVLCNEGWSAFGLFAIIANSGSTADDDTVFMVGSAYNLGIRQNVDCSLMCLKLCNRSIVPPAETPVSCKEQLRNISKFNAVIRFSQYRDSVSTAFRNAYITKCLKARKNERFLMRYGTREYHYTLYYYDQAGNLVQTVPPAGVKAIFSSVTLDSVSRQRKSEIAGTPIQPNHQLVTRYEYNTLNQLIRQRTPDAGISSFWYDALGRITLSQNARQNPSGRFSYTLYDALGRITEVGEIYSASSLDTVKANNHDTGYYGPFIAAATRTEITRTYYDRQLVVDTAQFGQDNLRNRVAKSTYQRVDGDEYEHATYFSYDIHGNVKTLIRQVTALESIDQAFKQTDYEFDLISGKVNRVIYQADEVDQYIHEYLYDNENRLVETRSGTRVELLERDASYTYYLHGPLARIDLGTLQVQGIDYAYTLGGWLKGVNSESLDSSRDIGRDACRTCSANMNGYVAKDAYGFTLNYFLGDYNPVEAMTQTARFDAAKSGSGMSSNAPQLFNGNISMMVTAIGKLMAEDARPLGTAYRYDQLNRLAVAKYFKNFTPSTNAWASGDTLVDYYNKFTYDGNGNILTQIRRGRKSVHTGMDSLRYTYIAGTNQLSHVDDDTSFSSYYQDDIDDQSANNYRYDAIGNLMHDQAEEIDTIEWTVYGKIRKIKRTSSSLKPDLEFEYTPDGHRAMKIVTAKEGVKLKTYTYYMRDAQGNMLCTYERRFNRIGDSLYVDSFAAGEWMIYGSSMLGMHKERVPLVNRMFTAHNTDGVLSNIIDSVITSAEYQFEVLRTYRGRKQYQLSNHLGNVLAVVSDKKLPVCANDTVSYYLADVLQATDYSPFGAVLNGRSGSVVSGDPLKGDIRDNLVVKLRSEYNEPLHYRATETIEFQQEYDDYFPDEYEAEISGDNSSTAPGTWITDGQYRYGFNGMEKDDEVSGAGNSYSTEYRQYDSRLGRWTSVDPEMKKYADVTPYNFSFNSPLILSDPSGADPNAGDGKEPDKDNKAPDSGPKPINCPPDHVKGKNVFQKIGNALSGLLSQIPVWKVKTTRELVAKHEVEKDKGYGSKGFDKTYKLKPNMNYNVHLDMLSVADAGEVYDQDGNAIGSTGGQITGPYDIQVPPGTTKIRVVVTANTSESNTGFRINVESKEQAVLVKTTTYFFGIIPVRSTERKEPIPANRNPSDYPAKPIISWFGINERRR